MAIPTDLTTISAVEAYLTNTPFAGHTIKSLSGGSAIFTYRIYLSTPFEGHWSLVLKLAQPYVKDLATVQFDLERQVRVISH